MRSKWQERHLKMFGYYSPYKDSDIKHDIFFHYIIRFLIGIQAACVTVMLGIILFSPHKMSESEQHKANEKYSKIGRGRNAQSNIQE